MHGCSVRLWIALLIGGSLVGCGRSLAAVDPTPAVAGDAYGRVFDATIHVLRDMRFVIDRDDRRFGVITTEPRIAPSVFEPWHPQNTTALQTATSTVNLQRRRVRVELEPLPRPRAEAVVQPWRYGLSVEVVVERRHHPPEQLHTAALGAVRTVERGLRYEPVLTEAGLQGSYWRLVGEDPYLERRLVRTILREAGVEGIERTRPDPRSYRKHPTGM